VELADPVYVPAGHCVQVLLVTKLPAAQEAHSVLPIPDVVPELHGIHSVELVEAE
jgi:hypothetical protein